MLSFEEFFERATGHTPHRYQTRLARDGLPAVLQAPTGTGKTAAILAWLWRRRHGPDRPGTPRRLIFALPQRTLVEQVAGEVERWLGNLGVTDQVPLHVVMGGAGGTQSQWRLELGREAIVVGTVDSLVSKALNRGYGIARSIYPVDFALVTNGAQWIIDEIQLCPESTTSLRQLAGFATGVWATAEPFGLTCMSATVSEQLLATVDNPLPAARDIVRIEPDDRVGELARRLAARRTVRRLAVEPGDYAALAAAAIRHHRPETLTLVVVNTVAAARAVYGRLPASSPRLLLHSRFRAVERQALTARLPRAGEPRDLIVVATQVVEAGVDIDAAVLMTEAAPWPSVVQRAGRCNRAGRTPDAELWWLPPARPVPYEASDVDASAAALDALEGVAITGEEMLAREVATTEPAVSVVRRTDLLALFDTAADLTGADIDVAPYIRDTEDLDVQLAWAQWTPADDAGRPPAAAKAPPPELRCRVPLGELRTLTKRATVWRFDQANDQWSKVDASAPARPGEVLLMAAADGGYDPWTGFDPGLRRPVPDAPSLDTPAADPAAGTEDAFAQDDASVAQRSWLSLQQHSEEVRDQAQALLDVIQPDLSPALRRAVVAAAFAHDAGKCHPTWQDTLCELAGSEERAYVQAGRPWAKSRVNGRLRFAGGVTFRHELVSAILLDGPLRVLLAHVEDPDLVRYLVLAHHGKIRIQVRGPEETDEKTLLGLRAGEVIRLDQPLLGQPAGEMSVDLTEFSFGGDRSWTRTALALRDRYGPFLLAYLEALVRMADWRASAGLPLPVAESASPIKSEE